MFINVFLKILASLNNFDVFNYFSNLLSDKFLILFFLFKTLAGHIDIWIYSGGI